MTPDRWRRIETLYHAAAERAPEDRAAFLADACRGDDDLREQVAGLLQEHLVEEGFAEGPSLSGAAALFVQEDPSLTGRRLGGYHLQELLGRGGMGEVYRAQDPRLARDVAIKVLPAAFTGDAQRLARLEREARMLAALNHPNICAIYGIEESGPVRYLILEIVEGRTLAEILAGDARSSPLPLRDVLSIARQVSEALEAAHDKGIIHRDLKPANIKITPDGVVKVLDFGLAKPTVTAGASDLTDGPTVINAKRGEGPILGTAAYMSPEQARGVTVDTRTDIWAFGCVLFEMLAGRLAFTGETVSDTIAKILEREPVWSALPASTPHAIRRLLVRCLAKDPRERLRDIGDARIEIAAVGEILPGVPPVLDGPRRRWPAALGVTAAVASAVVVLAIWLASVRSAASIENRFAKAQYTYVTEWEGVELDAAISTDGRFAAFVADASGAFQIWLTQLGTGIFENLTPDQVDERNRLNRPVGFSVDGSNVWISGSPAGRRLRTMPFTGGPLREFLEERAISVAWSADDTRVVYLRADTDGDPLFIGDRSGADARQILPGKEGEHNHFPIWSTDGRWVYYVHFTDEAFSADLWRVPSSGGAPERLTEQYKDVRYPTPIDTRTVLYVARDDDGGGPWLWALDVNTKTRTRVSVGPERYLSVAASVDASRLVATIGRSTASLWSIPILSNRVADEEDMARYGVSPVRAFAPRFGSAGLFYLSTSGSGDGLWRTQGENSVEIWKAGDGVLSDPAAIGPNGQMAITLRSKGRAHLVLVSPDGAVRRSVADGVDVRGTASWSPDGNWIVTAGRDSEDRPGLFKIPADGGVPVRIANGQALDPVWSPDGALIVYAGALAKATAPLLAVRPDGRPVALPPIRTSAQGGGCVRFLPDGTGVVYSLGPVGKQVLWLLDLATNKTRQLARLPGDTTTSSFDVAPDGKRIIFDRLRELSDVVLIQLKN